MGAGRIGIRRIEALKSFGSRVTVIAPSVGKGFSSSDIEFIKKSFSDEDIRDDYFIAVAATNNRCVNKRIGEICRAKGIFASIADSPSESAFYFPALCVGDNILAGVVSDGEHHSLVKKTAKKIREVIKHEENKDRQQRKPPCGIAKQADK